METALNVDELERGVVRVFSVARDVAVDDTLKALERALGVASLGARDVQVLKIADMDELGLAGLLTEGYDIAPDEIDMAALGAVEGYVAVVRSAAFKAPVTLALTGAALVGVYREQSAPAPMFTPLKSNAARGTLGGPAAEAKLAGGRGKRLLLIALAALVVSFLWAYFYYIGF